MINLSTISHIWNVIVMSNTFNFILFVLILAWVFKKIKIGEIIVSLQKKITKLLDDAKQERAIALNKLSSANKAVENLDEELKELVKDAEKSAGIVGEKIAQEAQKQLESIEANAQKIIEAEEKLLVSQLIKSTSQTSVEVAKSKIESALAETPTLHEKYINESIDELDRLNF